MDIFRKLFRQYTRPIPRKKARFFYDRLSIVYYLLAWTAGGIALTHMLTTEVGLPSELNVHAEPDKVNARVYRMMEMIKRSSGDSEVRVVNMKNFSVDSVEPYKANSLLKQAEEIDNRAKEDFYGDK